METRALGTSGERVSALCLGTMTFGDETSEDVAREMVDCFLEAGGNFIDTADVYQDGLAETMLGRVLGARRDRVFLATKGRMPMSASPGPGGASRRHLTRAVDASLSRLGTDWIDLYQIHWPDPDVPLEETLDCLNDLTAAGKIRYAGLSNYLGWELQRAIDACDRYHWAPVVSHQPQYSLVSREIEFDSLLVCLAHGLAVLPWSPLGGGILTGKYNGLPAAPEGTRLSAPMQARRRWSERNLRIATAAADVAAEIGKTSAQVSLNWLLSQPGVTSPIIGARNSAQLADNLGADGWRLGTKHLESLDEASQPAAPYPHDFYRAILPRP